MCFCFLESSTFCEETWRQKRGGWRGWQRRLGRRWPSRNLDAQEKTGRCLEQGSPWILSQSLDDPRKLQRHQNPRALFGYIFNPRRKCIDIVNSAALVWQFHAFMRQLFFSHHGLSHLFYDVIMQCAFLKDLQGTDIWCYTYRTKQTMHWLLKLFWYMVLWRLWKCHIYHDFLKFKFHICVTWKAW